MSDEILNCASLGDDQRVVGLLNGQINGVDLEDKQVRTFTNGKKGQTYFAVSDIPEYIGAKFLLIDELAAIYGWLFAKV